MTGAPRIGLYGGSFDPVHLGHVEIARRARDQVGLDAVWLLPAGRSPFKPDGPIADAGARVAMLEAAIAGEERLDVCTIDLEAPGQRSVDTVRALVARHPDHAWHWIMGEDSFDALPRWAEPEAFVELAPPIVQPRPGGEGSRPSRFAGAEVIWLRGEPMDVSSTAARFAIARGREPRGIDPAVRSVIETRSLYREEVRR